MGRLDYMVLLLLTLAQMSRSGDRKHETIVLSSNLSGSAYTMAIEGATVMAEEYYRDHNLAKAVTLMPATPDWFLQLQFVYLELPRSKPCEDSLLICETESGYSHFCSASMVKQFCGDLDDLFPSDRYSETPRYLTTTKPGHGVLITWKTSQPQGYKRGFQIIVTAYKKAPCSGPDVWRCAEGRCISPNLHCDNIAHCTDASDELINCNNTEFLVPSLADCALWNSKSCANSRWQERWFGLAIPLVIVMLLLFVATFVRIRRQLCGPVAESSPRRSRRRCRRRGNSQRSPTDESPPLTRTLPQNSISSSYDGHTLLLMPPPYSPPGYQHPNHGEPPPLYEDSMLPQYQQYKPEYMPSSSLDHSTPVIPSAPPLTPTSIRGHLMLSEPQAKNV